MENHGRVPYRGCICEKEFIINWCRHLVLTDMKIFPQARYSTPSFESSLSLNAVNLKGKFILTVYLTINTNLDNKVVHRKRKLSKTRSLRRWRENADFTPWLERKIPEKRIWQKTVSTACGVVFLIAFQVLLSITTCTSNS